MKKTSLSRRATRVAMLWLACLLCAAPAFAGDTRFITDVLNVSLRVGPGSQNAVIKVLPSDTALEVLEERPGYLRVRTEAGDEGWVPAQYVTNKTPKTKVIASLKQELADQQAKMQRLEDELRQAHEQGGKAAGSGGQDAVAAELAQLKQRYNALLSQSSHGTELSEENEALLAANNKLNREVETLQQENTSARRTGMIKWFLAGSGVFLGGFVVAKMTGSRRKKYY